MKGLTGKQKNIVEFIEDFTNTMEMAPTIYEIAEHFKIKTSTVFAHIRALQKKNVLTRSSKARSISLAKSSRKKSRLPAGSQSVPVVESPFINQAPTPGNALICDSKLFQKALGGRDLFAFKVPSSDMAGCGIYEGDMLLVKPNLNSVVKGDILLTMEDGEPVLRSCGKAENGICELQSGNPARKKISGKLADMPLKGIVIGLQRSL